MKPTAGLVLTYRYILYEVLYRYICVQLNICVNITRWWELNLWVTRQQLLPGSQVLSTHNFPWQCGITQEWRVGVTHWCHALSSEWQQRTCCRFAINKVQWCTKLSWQGLRQTKPLLVNPKKILHNFQVGYFEFDHGNIDVHFWHPLINCLFYWIIYFKECCHNKLPSYSSL